VCCVHIACLLESQVCLWRPFSIARLCSLSLYIALGSNYQSKNVTDTTKV
jgi:hypothetical protein